MTNVKDDSLKYILEGEQMQYRDTLLIVLKVERLMFSLILPNSLYSLITDPVD